MPLTYDQISAITQKKFIPKMYDNIFDTDPLLKRLKSKEAYKKLSGGERVVLPLNYAQVTASGWYSGADTLSTTDNEVITAAEYTWKQNYVNISVTGLDERKNGGDTQILDFVKSKVQIAEKTMADDLCDGLYSDGTEAKSIVGLRVIVGTANTVGGISQSSYSWWQGVVDSSTTTLTLAALQSQFTSLCLNNEHPTVIMATRANYNRYYALLQPQQRFQDSETAKGGFSNLMFNSVPFIAGSKVPTNHIFMLNENYLMLGVHKDADFKFEPFQKPINQDVKVAKILWMGMFGSSNNRMHGKLSAVAA